MKIVFNDGSPDLHEVLRIDLKEGSRITPPLWKITFMWGDKEDMEIDPKSVSQISE